MQRGRRIVSCGYHVDPIERVGGGLGTQTPLNHQRCTLVELKNYSRVQPQLYTGRDRHGAMNTIRTTINVPSLAVVNVPTANVGRALTERDVLIRLYILTTLGLYRQYRNIVTTNMFVFMVHMIQIRP